MFPGMEDDAVLIKVSDLDGKNRSFHGELLDRGKTCLPGRKRDRLAKLANRVTWIAVATWIGRTVGELAIFAGGLAIGVGLMLEQDNLREKRLVVLIAVGVGCIFLAILARLLARSGSRQLAEAARG